MRLIYNDTLETRLTLGIVIVKRLSLFFLINHLHRSNPEDYLHSLFDINSIINFPCKKKPFRWTDPIYTQFPEKKRRVYDQYGKDGLLGHNERSHRSRRHDYDDFDFGFVFRSPDEVFREFFGVNSPFADLFNDGT